MVINERLKSGLRLGVPLLFGVVVLWFIYRGMDMAEVARVLKAEVDYSFLIFSLVFGLLSNVIRGFRWHLLVRPIVPEGEAPPRLLNAIATVLGSYTVNMGIPRAGELWRCAEYQRHEQLPFSSLFGTLISDRLVDVLSLSLILGGCLIAYTDFFWGFFEAYPSIVDQVRGIAGSPWLYLLVALGILGLVGMVYLLRKSPNNRVSQFLLRVITGIRSVQHMPQRGLFIVYSVMIWIGYFAFFYTTFYAFPFTRALPLETGVLAFAMSSMSALAPVQAGLGPWHFMVITTLTAYGVSQSDAGAFALIVHTTQTLWITLIGLLAIVALPLINRHYRRSKPSN